MRRLLGERQPSPSRAFARSSPSRLEKTRLASRHPGSNPQPVYGGGSWNFAGLGSSGFVDHGYSESNVYSNPYGEDTRGQRAQTPISVSSGSWPQDDFPRPPVQVLSKRVRRMSSLDMEALPNKRHQSYQSPARPARPIQTVNGQVFIDELEEPNQEINGVRIYSSDEYYLSGRMVTRGAVNPHCGSSPQKTVFGNEGAFQMSPPADRQRFLSESDRQRFTRGRSVQPSLRHYITPDHHSLPRSPQQSTGFQNRYQMSPPERSRRQKLSGYAQRYVGPYYIPDQRDFRRVQSEAPTSFRNPPHGRSNGQINSPNGHSGPPAQQQLQLGSPISWKEPLGAGMSITDNFIPTPKIKGHYAVNLNGNQNLPFEPRGRSKSVAPHTLHNPHRPVNQRRRSKSRPPGAQVNQTVTRRSRSIVPETPRFKTLRTTPGVRSYQEIDDEDVYMEDNDGTPMEQLFRKPRLDWLASRTNLENCPFRAAKVLPKESISYNDRSKLEAVKSWTKNVKHSFGKPSPVYINLLSPPESSVKVPPVRRSVPMKDRIAPAKKKETPTFNKKRKPTAEKEKAEAEAAAEDARQQRAADTIVDTEIKAVIKDLFGEISSQGRDKEKGRLEAQRKCEERELRLRKDEAAKLLDLEKKRLREEVEEKERREKEIEDARKKAKREAERKRSDAAEEAVRDEKRKMAQEKIEADRAEEAAKNIAEAADSERKKLLALTVQADPAELAKLKAKQDVAKQQAAALSTGNLFAIEEAKNATARASSPPQTSLRNFNPTMEDDAEMEDNSLFVPEYPPQSYRLVNNLPSKQRHNQTVNKNSGNITNGSNYVPANTISKAGSPEEETAYGVDESRRQRTKCAGPSSAAEVFAQASSSKWPGREGYLAGRAAYEAKIEAERSEKAAAAAKAKLEARWKSKSVERTQSEQIQERPAPKKTAPAREKVKGDQALKKSHPAPKSKAKPKSAEPRAESTPEVEQSLRPGAGQTPPGLAISLPASDSLITPASTVINKAATSSGSTLVGMRILDPPKLGPLHPNQNDPKSGIKVISDLKRQRFDNAQTQRQSQQKKSTKERTENQKEEAVSKRANRAREKEKMRLIEEARTNCVELSGEELDEHLEVFMARRAVCSSYEICQRVTNNMMDRVYAKSWPKPKPENKQIKYPNRTT
jgi:hypothetical protein